MQEIVIASEAISRTRWKMYKDGKMLSNKERLVWIFIALTGIVVTYFASKNGTATRLTQQITVTTTCSAYPQPASTLEAEANEWFTSEIDKVSSRNQYNLEIIDWKWNWFCEQYQDAFETNASWLNDPIEIAMKSQGYPVFENSGPNIVTAIFGKSSQTAVVLLIYTNLPDDSIKDQEWRIDLVKSNNKTWKILWIGYRQKCRRTGSDDWVAERCL